MISVNIPGRGLFNLEVLVLDFNGTLALDGELLAPVADNIRALAKQLEIHILTSDTYGTVARKCKGLPVQVKVLESAEHSKEKAAYLSRLGAREIVAVGNGANDRSMLEHAYLGITVIGTEGCSARTLLASDIVVTKIEDAFGLLLNPQRLVATLRE